MRAAAPTRALLLFLRPRARGRYSRVKRGYARGWEPAKYVEQVRQYLAVLEWTGTGTVARLHQDTGLPLAPLATEGRGFN